MEAEAGGRAGGVAAGPAAEQLLERSVVIRARPQTVFGFFTDSARWASWWGEGSEIDARVGGAIRIVYPGGTEVTGEILTLDEPNTIAFTYGYTSGEPVPAGSTTVTIRLEAVAEGTRVDLEHVFADAAVRDMHVAGWDYQLALFANLVFDTAVAKDAEATVDRWFSAWSDVDDERRATALATLVSNDITYRDRFACVAGRLELLAHITAARKHGAGEIERTGALRRTQGLLLADWTTSHGTGATLFELDPDGRIVAAAGFWNP